MLGTYLCLAACLVAAALVGQAVLAACGRREWSPLAPAIGLAVLCPLAWWTVRLPGEAGTALVAIALAATLAAAYLVPHVVGVRAAVVRQAGIALAAVALASLPFMVEWRFGILGTGLNPDMSQHLFATDRLAEGAPERLSSQGYPLGPHSLAAALAAIGPSTVQAFAALTIATAVAACLAALALLDTFPRGWRAAGALCVGFAYLVAAFLVQGAFKETLQALFVLAFAIVLGQLAHGWSRREEAAPRPLRAIPLAVLAIGSVYTYSFPGLLWLGGAAAVWALVELARAWRRSGAPEARLLARLAAPSALAAIGVVLIAIAPEASRIVDFAGFETFNPSGAGLGNLFNRLSPLEALGIWPSGDFRVEPGDGAAPAFAFYLGAAAGAAALAYGLRRSLERGDRALPAALAAAALLWLYALIGGTPYQEAKALVLIAPLALALSVRALVAAAVPALVAAAFLVGAGGSSVLALVNGPVGPSGYSPALAELRPELGPGSVLVIAPEELLDEQHGADYLAWELRGNRVCVEAEGDVPKAEREGVAVTVDVALADDGAVVVDEVTVNRRAQGPGPCPLIPGAARADPSAGG